MPIWFAKKKTICVLSHNLILPTICLLKESKIHFSIVKFCLEKKIHSQFAYNNLTFSYFITRIVSKYDDVRNIGCF